MSCNPLRFLWQWLSHPLLRICTDGRWRQSNEMCLLLPRVPRIRSCGWFETRRYQLNAKLQSNKQPVASPHRWTNWSRSCLPQSRFSFSENLCRGGYRIVLASREEIVAGHAQCSNWKGISSWCFAVNQVAP